MVFVGILVKNDSGDDGNGKANQAKKEVPVDGNSCARKAGIKGSSLYFNCCRRCDMKIFNLGKMVKMARETTRRAVERRRPKRWRLMLMLVW